MARAAAAPENAYGVELFDVKLVAPLAGPAGRSVKVQVLQGGLEVSSADRKELREAEIASGWRLSCQARVYQDTVCLVPELQRVPRAATMGVNRLVLLDPNVRKVYVELPEPSLDDQRGDVERLRDALTAEGFDMKAGVSALNRLPGTLRAGGFKVTAVLGGDQLIAVEAGGTRESCYGVAFDVGTTTVVVRLPALMVASPLVAV